MTLRRVLGLGTYPVVSPVHGGQRRVNAIRTFYRRIGIDYVHACVYDSTIYGPPLVGPHDIPLVAASTAFGPTALTGDLLSGLQSETHDPSWRHFLQTMERVKPDALQLEQAFMWPLAKRVLQTAGQWLPIIYSSHNVEAPLKLAIMESSGVARELRDKVTGIIENIESEICNSAALIVCVSLSDRGYYRQLAACPIIVASNGVDRPPATPPDRKIVRTAFGNNRFVFTVGSAYVPNIEGFCDCVAEGGIFFSPPLKSIAVCGGISDGILGHPKYQRFLAANSARVSFFPQISDIDLWAIKNACHGVVLPILSGGGSNLKTAEALTLGKWIVATPTALRGFEAFADAEGVIVAKNRRDFHRGIARVLRAPPLEMSEASRKARDVLHWDVLFETCGLADELRRI